MKKELSQVANELIESIGSHLDDERIGNPFFPERGVRPFPLTPDGFKIVQRVDSDKKTAFVDGGNQEILGAPNFSIQLNRVYFGVSMTLQVGRIIRKEDTDDVTQKVIAPRIKPMCWNK